MRLLVFLVLGLLWWQARGAVPEGADLWFTNSVQYPVPSIALSHSLPPAAGFALLHADVVAGKLKIYWPAEGHYGSNYGSNTLIEVFASADELGHWPARDWHAYAMSRRGTNYEANVPVENIEVPIVYFLQVARPTTTEGRPAGMMTKVSPMRICRPNLLGLEQPSELPWAFLEGFEQGIGSWKLLPGSEEAPALRTDAGAKTGRAALRVGLPPRGHSVTMATTQIRGWQLDAQRAMGIRLWLRTGAGTGRARFTLLANAYTPGQKVGAWPKQTVVGETWQQVDLLFSELREFPIGQVDVFAIELIGNAPTAFFVDDIQLLGPLPAAEDP